MRRPIPTYIVVKSEKTRDNEKFLKKLLYRKKNAIYKEIIRPFTVIQF